MVVVLLSALSVTVAGSHETLLDKWNLWKARHRKVYSSHKEESNRRLTWLRNYQEITQHNSANYSFVLQQNQFSDLVRLQYADFFPFFCCGI